MGEVSYDIDIKKKDFIYLWRERERGGARRIRAVALGPVYNLGNS